MGGCGTKQKVKVPQKITNNELPKSNCSSKLLKTSKIAAIPVKKKPPFTPIERSPPNLPLSSFSKKLIKQLKIKFNFPFKF